jgi:hypothetical protein
MNTNIITHAFDAVESDFFLCAEAYDKWVVAKFCAVYKVRADNLLDQAWLDSLPEYVLRDLQRSIRNVANVNKRMERDMNREPVREYVGRGNTSHRKARS